MRNVFFGLMLAVVCLMMGSTALAADGAPATAQSYAFLAAGLGIALAAFGGAISQGKTAASALEGIARNPNAADKMFVPMVLGLVLIESLVIYALVIEILILFSGKIS